MPIIDSLRNKFAPKPVIPTVKVCMMGGKGAGKSSILASLYANASENLAGTQFYMTPAGNTISVLGDKLNDLREMFDFAQKQDEVPAGISGDYEVNVYDFEFGLTENNKNGRIQNRKILNMEFKDFPGETISSSPEMVSGFIDESSVVLIAIDTPHLMEENALFCETRNRCNVITKFIKETLDDEIKAHKLFLLVPLKCEKYYHEKRMAEVCDRVNAAYSVLINELRTKYKTEIACAITPILTLGDIVFQEFELDSDGKLKVNKFGESDILPTSVRYKYRNSEAKYSPKFCEQPLYYLLSYISKEYQLSSQAEPASILGKILSKFAGLFKLVSDDPSFLIEVAKLKRKQLKNKPSNNPSEKDKPSPDGYLVVSGRNLI